MPRSLEFSCEYCGTSIDEGQTGAFFVEVVRWGKRSDGWAEPFFCSQEHVAAWFSQPDIELSRSLDDSDDEDDDTTRLEDARDFVTMVIVPTLVVAFAGIGVFSLIMKLTTGEF